MKILLCDDSRTIRAILRALLEDLDQKDVTEVTNGNEALAALTGQRYDLLLLDIHMPERDGLSCLQEIRRRDAMATTAVVFISSDTDPVGRRQAEELGALGFIGKPFSFEAVEGALAAARAANAGLPPG